MSQYANYFEDSSQYDSTRIPIGLEVILGCLAQHPVPASEQTVLEAGCGTGNYLRALQRRFRRLVGIDSSQQMLDEARVKLDDHVQLIQGDVLELPLQDASFQAVICNQVIHHLEEGPSANDDPADWPANSFQNIGQFLREAHRVLQPEGVMVLNFSQPQQVRDGFWWADLIPTAIERIACRTPTLSQLQQLMSQAGFDVTLAIADLNGVLQGSSYLDPAGPLKEEWRAGDSTWTLASDAELAEAVQRVKAMHNDNSIAAYLAGREELRLAIGQTTFVCGRKS
jgi:ubiquinone/menaquinone biosynthesis C-methylase UbiE